MVPAVKVIPTPRIREIQFKPVANEITIPKMFKVG